RRAASGLPSGGGQAPCGADRRRAGVGRPGRPRGALCGTARGAGRDRAVDGRARRRLGPPAGRHQTHRRGQRRGPGRAGTGVWDVMNERGSDTVQRRHVALAATLALAAACWVVVIRQMSGMDMGVATRLGSFVSFAVLWVPMMAAMMLPGAA